MTDRTVSITLDLIDGFTETFYLQWDGEDFYPPYDFFNGCLIVNLSPSETNYYPLSRIKEVKVIHDAPK